MEREILLLGDPRLYEVSAEVEREELPELRPVFEDLFDCIRGIRRDYGFGRAIAAPQIGVQKRLICILTDRPYVIINPELEFVGEEKMELMLSIWPFISGYMNRQITMNEPMARVQMSRAFQPRFSS